MRKNRMMRVASALLVVVLLTTCAISGTFAKYVTEDSATETARVAKWGVEFVTASNMFNTSYDYKDHPSGVAGTLSVKSTEDVVAPGTSGEGYSFTTVGAPEVSYQVTFELDTTDSKTVHLNEEYYPIVYTLKLTDDIEVTGSLADITPWIGQYTYMYDVHSETYYVSENGGTDWVSYGATAPKLELSWTWEFSVDDVKDTALGNLAAGYDYAQIKDIAVTSHNLDIVIDITATATQID